MKSGRLLLEMLKLYNVEYVFGLPGETTLGWYDEWKKFDGIEHIMVRDERNAVFMADGYAKVSGKPGICEGPSVGAPHMLPGVVEAYSSGIPIIVITSDIPLNGEKHNMLTGADQTSMFKAFVKDTFSIHHASDIPFIVRRAFRLATSGRPGPVHIRLPQDVLKEDVDVKDLYAQPEFSVYPGKRFRAGVCDVEAASKILRNSQKGVMICGQGALLSGAWQEVEKTAEKYGLAVLTTINGKGIINESSMFSGGIAGARGANSIANTLVKNADMIFFVGSSTDSAGTGGWRFPEKSAGIPMIQLDVSEAELGNNYPVAVSMLGDVKATLQDLLALDEDYTACERDHLKELASAKAEYEKSIMENAGKSNVPCDPARLSKIIEQTKPQDSIIVVDPGISAVYPAGFIKSAGGRRDFVCNFAQGSLGYATAAAIGAAKASPGSTIIHLTGDGSFGFCAGEYETLARTGCNVKIILINNHSFGWIRVSNDMAYENEPFATEFSDMDYVKTVEGFGIPAKRLCEEDDAAAALQSLFAQEGPAFLEVVCEPEDKLVPPVPGWAEKARKKGMKNYY